MTRRDYIDNVFQDVIFITTGSMGDLRCEVRFVLGNSSFKLEIKKHLVFITSKHLTSLSNAQASQRRYFALASATFQGSLSPGMNADPSTLDRLATVAIQGAEAIVDRYFNKSYRAVLEPLVSK